MIENNVTLISKLVNEPKIIKNKNGTDEIEITLLSSVKKKQIVKCYAWKKVYEKLIEHYKNNDILVCIGAIETNYYDENDDENIENKVVINYIKTLNFKDKIEYKRYEDSVL